MCMLRFTAWKSGGDGMRRGIMESWSTEIVLHEDPELLILGDLTTNLGLPDNCGTNSAKQKVI